MHKKSSANCPKTLQTGADLPLPLGESLDFTESRQQVTTLMKSVLHETTQNENKIQFIKELLNDQRYQINPKLIASKMLAFTNIPLPELEPEL
jgi:anti-sigma28 factor (negative regulator of flagellin synthesis)